MQDRIVAEQLAVYAAYAARPCVVGTADAKEARAERDLAAWRLYRRYGWPVERIAATVGVRPGYVRGWISRARTRALEVAEEWAALEGVALPTPRPPDDL